MIKRKCVNKHDQQHGDQGLLNESYGSVLTIETFDALIKTNNCLICIYVPRWDDNFRELVI